MGLVVGALYGGGRGHDQQSVSDRTGAIFFVLVNQSFSTIASIRVFLEERAVVDHERRRRAYGVAPYFLAKTAAELPAQTLCALLFGVLAYRLAGLRRDPAAAAAHAAILALATLVAESLSLAVGAIAPDARTAVALGPALLSVSLLFAGFLVTLDSLPAPTRLFQATSLFRHAFAALLKIEFGVDAPLTCAPRDTARLARTLRDAGAPPALLADLPCPIPDSRAHLHNLLGPAVAAAPVATTELPALLLLFLAFRAAALLALRRRLPDPSSSASSAPRRRPADDDDHDDHLLRDARGAAPGDRPRDHPQPPRPSSSADTAPPNGHPASRAAGPAARDLAPPLPDGPKLKDT